MGTTIRTATAAAFAVMALTAGSASASSICGDVNDSGTVTASDALSVLKAAVGQAVELLCAPPGQLLKTGQTICYDAAGSEIACAGTAQDGELQKGVVRSFTDNGDGTVTDNVTGLMWEKHSDDGTIHDKDNLYTWSSAFASKVAALNSASFANHDDWRVPNIFELESLRNMGAANPATYSAFNSSCSNGCAITTCSCTRSYNDWSSSTDHAYPSYAWYVSFSDGFTGADLKTREFGVRAVRAGS